MRLLYRKVFEFISELEDKSENKGFNDSGFRDETVYVVRRYQRLYVWNREDQWDPLWEDVINIATKIHEYIVLGHSEAVETRILTGYQTPRKIQRCEFHRN